MKRRRARLSGSQTPWERLCGEGFAAADDGFVLLVDNAQHLLAATSQWHERFRGWWRWSEGQRAREVAPAAGARAAWRRWLELIGQALRGGGGRRRRVTLRQGARARVTLNWISRPLHDSGGRPIGVVMAGRFGGRRRRVADRMATRAVLTVRPGEMFSFLVRPSRRAGEGGDFIEDLSFDGATRLAHELQVGAEFPAALPATWRAAGRRAVAQARVNGGPVTVELPALADAPPWQLAVLPMGAGRCNAVLRATSHATATQQMLLACGEQLVGLEAELRRAQRLATQGMLAAAIGHEVNNCLGIALANASLFSEQHGANSPAAARAIAPVIHAVQTAGRICDRFRHLGGSTPPALAVLDLAATVQRSFDMLVRIIQRRFTLEFRYAGELLVRADHTHIEQMVVNLVLNAREIGRAHV